jgi:hypothetical protein
MPHAEEHLSAQHDRDLGDLASIIPAQCGSVAKPGEDQLQSQL